MSIVLQWERKAALPLRQPDDDAWQRLLAIADRAAPATRKRILEAIAALVENMDTQTIVDALANGDIEEMLQAIPFDDFRDALEAMHEALESTREQSFDLATTHAEPRLDRAQLRIVREHIAYRSPAAAGGGAQPPRPPAKPEAQLIAEFRLVSEPVATAIKERGAARIVDVTEETRAAVRQLAERAYREGKAPKTIVKEIRQVVGLTRRQETAVENYRHAQLDAEVPPARVDKLVEKYSNKLRKQRAERIARTETIQAMNDGQRASWVTLVEKGLLDPNVWEREWMAIVPNDGRTCVICEGLDGKRAPIGGRYEGNRVGPPEHPDCRCTEKLVPKHAEAT